MNQDLSGAASPNLSSDESSISDAELRKINAYWRACNYLSLGMLYLSGNPLLREPLQVKDIKERLIGHWGSDPGQSFIRVHLNRLIKKYDLNMIYIAGPGHGAPATLANSYLEGRYSEVYRDMSENEEGMARLLNNSHFQAESAAIAPQKHQVRFTKAANWATVCPTPSALRSTIQIS